MVLRSCTKNISRPVCDPGFESLHCVAHRDRHISEVQRYLHAAFEGLACLKDRPTVTCRVQSKLITSQQEGPIPHTWDKTGEFLGE